MTEQEAVSSEQRLVRMDSWFDKFKVEGKVDQTEPQLVRDVLEKFGANFEISQEARISLGRYSNLAKKIGLQEVWGQKADEFKGWVKNEYIPQYEANEGRELPTLYDPKTGLMDNIKHSGMMQFFGELTSFAAGEMSFAKYKRITEHRLDRGRRWKNNDPENPFVVHEKNAPVPPEYPLAAWQKIKSWKS